MSDGLATTFRLLAQTPNEAAVRALTAALDSRLEPVRRQALEALITRRSSGGKREVLARIDQLDEEALALLRRNASRMTATLRAVILGTGDPLRSNACRAALMLEEVDLIPALVGALEDPADPSADELGDTLLRLSRLLANQSAVSQTPAEGHAPRAVRDNALVSLERAMLRFSRQDRAELVEAFAMLATSTSPTLQRVLSSTGNPAAAALLDQFANNRHPAITRLVLDFLDEPDAPLAAITTLARRGDLEFVRLLLSRTGDRPSPAICKNLKRLRSVVWLQDHMALLDQLDGDEQGAAVGLALMTRIPRENVFRLIRHLILHGKPGGRRAAAKALQEFSGTEANELALRALDDPDPKVQASILGQLRRRSIPGALPRLLQMVESPHPEVCHAAQENLAEFSFQRFFGAFDMLDEEVRRATGEMVKKIDPFTVPQLREQLLDSQRVKRLRAVEVAVALRLVDELEETIGELLDDEDQMVRLHAVSALSQAVTPWSQSRLHDALDDPSELVRAAAKRSLDDRRLFEHWQQVWSDPRD